MQDISKLVFFLFPLFFHNIKPSDLYGHTYGCMHLLIKQILYNFTGYNKNLNLQGGYIYCMDVGLLFLPHPGLNTV